MGWAPRYAYLDTRVSVMANRILPDERLQALIDLAPGQEGDIFHAAALTGLRLDEPSEPPSSLEQRLITLLMADFVIFVRALSGAAREFLLYWAYRFELSNLKAILRGKMTDQKVEAIRDQLVGQTFRQQLHDLLLALGQLATTLAVAGRTRRGLRALSQRRAAADRVHERQT